MFDELPMKAAIISGTEVARVHSLLLVAAGSFNPSNFHRGAAGLHANDDPGQTVVAATIPAGANAGRSLLEQPSDCCANLTTSATAKPTASDRRR
jgi:hypothetical protein